MLKAIIFDCDGVIADTEPLHLAAFQKVLDEEQITLTREEYFQSYLALDDRGCFGKVFSDRGKSLDNARLRDLIRRKALYIEPVMRANLSLFPGVADFIRQASEYFPLAVASGALGHEVELVLRHGGVRECFCAIISAEDVAHGKPHPEPFLRACERIGNCLEEQIEPAECLVIEDSIHGVEAAHRAGMRCVAVTNSYPKAQLSKADLVLTTLAGFSLEEAKSLFL